MVAFTEVIVQRIVEACRRARARGFVVTWGWWGVQANRERTGWRPHEECLRFDETGRLDETHDAAPAVCPLGAVLLAEDRPMELEHDGHVERIYAAALALGVSVDWVEDFLTEIDQASEYDRRSGGREAARAVVEALRREGLWRQ